MLKITTKIFYYSSNESKQSAMKQNSYWKELGLSCVGNWHNADAVMPLSLYW